MWLVESAVRILLWFSLRYLVTRSPARALRPIIQEFDCPSFMTGFRGTVWLQISFDANIGEGHRAGMHL